MPPVRRAHANQRIGDIVHQNQRQRVSAITPIIDSRFVGEMTHARVRRWTSGADDDARPQDHER